MKVGRAERVRLQRRLAIARRGAELLDRKRQILADEAEHLELQARRTGRDWSEAAAEAAVWAARTAALDGPGLVLAAAPHADAVARVETGSAMGVPFPTDTHLDCPPARQVGGSSALARAVAAHRAALDAAVAHAAATRAVVVVRAELEATRTRQRAVERRLVPRLEGELAEIQRALEELEMSENVRLRWAAGITGRHRG